MSDQSGWVVIYRAANGWSFRSRAFSTQGEASRQAQKQMERGVFAAVNIYGPKGEVIELAKTRTIAMVAGARGR